MRARTKSADTTKQFLLSYQEAATRYAVSVNTVKKFALEANAIVRMGKSARIIANKLDNYLCEIAG